MDWSKCHWITYSHLKIPSGLGCHKIVSLHIPNPNPGTRAGLSGGVTALRVSGEAGMAAGQSRRPGRTVHLSKRKRGRAPPGAEPRRGGPGEPAGSERRPGARPPRGAGRRGKRSGAGAGRPGCTSRSAAPRRADKGGARPRPRGGASAGRGGPARGPVA